MSTSIQNNNTSKILNNFLVKFNISDTLKLSIEPEVIITILESWGKRKEEINPTIGCIMGRHSNIYKSKTPLESHEKIISHIEITEAFTIPVVHKEGYHYSYKEQEKIVNILQKIYIKDTIVGFFQCDNDKFDFSYQTHNTFQKGFIIKSGFVPLPKLKMPMILNIIPSLNDDTKTNKQIDIKCLTIVESITEEGIKKHNVIDLPFEMTPYYCDDNRLCYTGLDNIISQNVNNDNNTNYNYSASTKDDLNKLKVALKNLLSLIKKCKQYTEGGENNPIQQRNNNIGRLLFETIGKNNAFSNSDWQGMISAALQDSLMIMVLSDVTKKQIEITECLNKNLY